MSNKDKKKMTINEKYLEALKTLDGWVTISEWAQKFADMYPDQLAKAEKQAAGQKNETTGLREIAARISSQTSRNGFGGQVEEDRSERPRRVRFLNEVEAKIQEEREIEEDIEPITRRQKEKTQFDALSVKEKYRITELQDIISQFNKFFGTDFELEHAQALLNRTEPGDHHPDNVQILLRSHNRTKNSNNWQRFSIEEQVEYISSVVNIQKIIAKKMNLDIQDDILDLLLERTRKVFS